MAKRTGSSQKSAQPLVAESVFVWFAAIVLGYSILVPLLAIDSLYLANALLRFAILQQVALLVLVILKVMNLFTCLITGGFRKRYSFSLIAIVLLLAVIQPGTNCCTNLVGAIAGAVAWSEVSTSDLANHSLPIIACSTVILEALNAERKAIPKSFTSRIAR